MIRPYGGWRLVGGGGKRFTVLRPRPPGGAPKANPVSARNSISATPQSFKGYSELPTYDAHRRITWLGHV